MPNDFGIITQASCLQSINKEWLLPGFPKPKQALIGNRRQIQLFPFSWLEEFGLEGCSTHGRCLAWGYSRFLLSQNRGMMGISSHGGTGMRWALSPFRSNPFHDSVILSPPARSCHWIFSIPAVWSLTGILPPLPAGRENLLFPGYLGTLLSPGSASELPRGP